MGCESSVKVTTHLIMTFATIMKMFTSVTCTSAPVVCDWAFLTGRCESIDCPQTACVTGHYVQTCRCCPECFRVVDEMCDLNKDIRCLSTLKCQHEAARNSSVCKEQTQQNAREKRDGDGVPTDPDYDDTDIANGESNEVESPSALADSETGEETSVELRTSVNLRSITVLFCKLAFNLDCFEEDEFGRSLSKPREPADMATNPESLKRYIDALMHYYAVLGRPRFGKK